MSTTPTPTVEANGLRFGALEAGEGPLVLCFHGFPDTAHTWDALLPRLADAGYHAVAPSMRGYPPTQIPDDGDYGGFALGRDVLGLIDAFGAKEAILIGHDWGAFAVYMAAAMAPEKVKKLITVAIPHPSAIRATPKYMWKFRHFIEFQFKERTIRKLTRNDSAYIDKIYRRWSPSWNFGPEETADVKRAFRTRGVIEAALGYYWSFRKNATGPTARAIRDLMAKTIDVPTLAFAGSHDLTDVSLFERAGRKFTGGYQLEVVTGVGHFLHREASDRFIERTLQFIGPPSA